MKKSTFAAFALSLIASMSHAHEGESLLIQAEAQASQLTQAAKDIGRLSSSASAERMEAHGGPLRLSDGDPYEVLKSFYESSRLPAQAADFDAAGTTGRQKCVQAAQGRPTATSMKIKRVVKVTPARLAQGPLLPGAPGSTAEKVMAWGGGDADAMPFYDLSEAIVFFDLIQNAQEGEDFVIRVAKIPGLRGTPLTGRLRKNGELIAFRLRNHQDDAARTAETYGYCYRD